MLNTKKLKKLEHQKLFYDYNKLRSHTILNND